MSITNFPPDMNITLFGSPFDPPHNGHVQLTEYVLGRGLAEQIWLVPTRQHPFDKSMSPIVDRLAMTELAFPIATDDRYQLEKSELLSSRPSYSLLTLRDMKARHPDHIFSWLIGSDNVTTFSQWWRYDELLAEFSVLVYPRVGSESVALLPGMVCLQDAPLMIVSSTQVRDLVSEAKDFSNLVSPQVSTYIKDHHLYQKV